MKSHNSSCLMEFEKNSSTKKVRRIWVYFHMIFQAVSLQERFFTPMADVWIFYFVQCLLVSFKIDSMGTYRNIIMSLEINDGIVWFVFHKLDEVVASSPVCDLRCSLKLLSLRTSCYKQDRRTAFHQYEFSCVFNVLGWLNCLSQSGQTNGFSPV